MNTYETIPREVQAVQVKWENWSAICDFLPVPQNGHGIDDCVPELRVFVWCQGEHDEHDYSTVAREGDWLVRKGTALMVVEDDDFHATYRVKPDLDASGYRENKTCQHKDGFWYMGTVHLQPRCAQCGSMRDGSGLQNAVGDPNG